MLCVRVRVPRGEQGDWNSGPGPRYQGDDDDVEAPGDFYHRVDNHLVAQNSSSAETALDIVWAHLGVTDRMCGRLNPAQPFNPFTDELPSSPCSSLNVSSLIHWENLRFISDSLEWLINFHILKTSLNISYVGNVRR